MTEQGAGFSVSVEIAVAWGDMDAFAHVNNTVFLRWFETARIEYFRRLRMMEWMEETGVGPILAATTCRFLLPVTYPDTVVASTRVPSVGEDRFVMEYRVESRRHGRDAARGEGTIVTYDYRSSRKAPVPSELRRRIDRLEGRPVGPAAG